MVPGGADGSTMVTAVGFGMQHELSRRNGSLVEGIEVAEGREGCVCDGVEGGESNGGGEATFHWRVGKKGSVCRVITSRWADCCRRASSRLRWRADMDRKADWVLAS